MRAMILKQTGSLGERPEPLELVELRRPEPGPGEVLIEVAACGVCHTELDEIEGRTAPPELPVVPGHEIVGVVVERGPGAERHSIGGRVGVGWIHSSDGSETENLSDAFVATGRDVNGGYAEYVTVPEGYAYEIPERFGDAEAAPLLCAGAIGYRSLRLAGLENGQAVGLTGFGASGHLVLQLARHLYPASEVYVFARDPDAREFARELGAAWAGATEDRAPERLQAVIDTTPAWKPVVEALANLAPGGRLVINAIRKEAGDQDYLQRLVYHEHLWMEREIKSVANITGRDIREFLPIAAEIPIETTVETYPLEEANRALRELRAGGARGAKVLLP
ncbi:MAG: zinc-dependent alcohol dehydrogenase family protein [Gemmatimonadales bacterium]|jgi:propanol-preferring alcohol dehydrogenase